MEEKKYKIKNPYVRAGITLGLTGLFIAIAVYFVNHIDKLGNGIEKLNDVLMPFFLGFAIAYLLCPIYNFFARHIYKAASKKMKKALGFSKVISTIITYLILFAGCAGLGWLVIPDLIDNITQLIPKIEPAFNNVVNWIQANIDKNPEIAKALSGQLDNFSTNLVKWAKNIILPGIEGLASGIGGAIATITDIIIGLIASIYFINSKELFAAQGKKLILASFKKERSDSIFELFNLADQTFGGFINGKIIDSVIIGIICFILMTILKIPAAPIISVIVGITNVIPFFGPFIGAIPSVLILILISPIGCLKFIIMILILQQFDGNILSPKIVGKATNLSSFWVMFAIIFFGGFFGFLGMILGVPIFALIYTYVTRAVNKKLKEKGIETKRKTYENYDKITVAKKISWFKRKNDK